MAFRVLLSPPDVGPIETQFVAEALASGWVAPAGPALREFELEITARTGRAHAVALSSGTAALHLALVACGVGPGDVVPVSTLTFIATVNAIRYVGATPFFVDVDEESGNIAPELLEHALARLQSEGASVPAVVVVDVLGKCADYTTIAAVLGRHPGVRLISDSAESFGAVHGGSPAGSFGEAAIFSFNGNKVLTTSAGGALVTDDSRLAARVRKLASQAREPGRDYEHAEVGYNYRMSNVLAALGSAQMSRLEELLKRRRGWRDQYHDVFAGQRGVRILGGTSDDDDNCWLTAVIVDPDVAGWNSVDLEAALERDGVESRPIWKPMHLQQVCRGWPGTITGAAERLFSTGLTLPSGSGMSQEDFDVVLTSIRGLLP